MFELHLHLFLKLVVRFAPLFIFESEAAFPGNCDSYTKDGNNLGYLSFISTRKSLEILKEAICLLFAKHCCPLWISLVKAWTNSPILLINLQVSLDCHPLRCYSVSFEVKLLLCSSRFAALTCCWSWFIIRSLSFSWVCNWFLEFSFPESWPVKQLTLLYVLTRTTFLNLFNSSVELSLRCLSSFFFSDVRLRKVFMHAN